MKIEKEIDISSYFSSRLSCKAKAVWILQSNEDIPLFIRHIQKESKWAVIGRGSNLIPSADYFDGVIITLDGVFTQYNAEWSRGEIIAGAAVTLPKLARAVIEQGWEGFERLGGVPGSLGGAVVMNAGVGEQGKYNIGPFVESVQILKPQGDCIWYKPDNQDFSYRHSIFIYKFNLILKVKLKFYNQIAPEKLFQVFKENMDYRRKTQPLQQPNWGSTFINPPGKYAAHLIEECGLKGVFKGNMQVSDKHANFFVNRGQAKSSEALELIEYVQSIVYQVRYLEEEAQRVKDWFHYKNEG
jgi:UDP-N-acetylmuramate dehydrogenase